MSLPRFIAKDETMEWFVSHCHRRRYPAKSTIIYQGDKSESLYFILEGSVTVVIEDNDDTEAVEDFGDHQVVDEEEDGHEEQEHVD